MPSVVRQFKLKTTPTTYSDSYHIGAEAKYVRAALDIPRMENPRVIDANTVLTELNIFRLKFYEEGCFYTGKFSDTWPYTAVVDCPGLKTEDPFFFLVGPMLDVETESGVFVDTMDTVVANLTQRKLNFSLVDEADCKQDGVLTLTCYLAKPEPFNFYIRLYSGTQTIVSVVTIAEQDMTINGKNIVDLVTADTKVDNKGDVTGTLKWSGDSYFVPLRLKGGVSGTNMTIKNGNKTIYSGPFTNEILVPVTNNQDLITLNIDGREMFTLNLENVEFRQEELKNRVKIADTSTSILNYSVSNLIANGTTLKADGRAIGTLKYVVGYDTYNNTFEGQQGYYLPLHMLMSGYKMTIMKNGTVLENEVPFRNDFVVKIDSKDDIISVSVDGAPAYQIILKDIDLEEWPYNYVVENGVYLLDENGKYLVEDRLPEWKALSAGATLLKAGNSFMVTRR